ncbi:MAG: DUF6491 family protein [Steroidobacteraceae bacterium]
MKHSRALRILGLLSAAALLASCSVVRTMEWQRTTRHALLDADAGKPVTHITYLKVGPGRLVAVSANQLVTWTDFTQLHAYLITVGNGCPDLYLNGAYVTSTGDEVWARSDHVIAAGLFRCDIQTIQPVDWLRVQRELSRLEQSGRHALPSDATVRSG